MGRNEKETTKVMNPSIRYGLWIIFIVVCTAVFFFLLELLV